MRFTLLLLLLFAVSALATSPPIIWGPPCMRLDEGEGIPRSPKYALRNPTKPEVVEEGERFVLNASRVTYDQAERYLERALRVAESGKEGLRRCKEAIEKGQVGAAAARKEKEEKKKEMKGKMNAATKQEEEWVAQNDKTKQPQREFNAKVKEFYKTEGLVEKYAEQRKEYDETLQRINDMEPAEAKFKEKEQKFKYAHTQVDDFHGLYLYYNEHYKNKDDDDDAKSYQGHIIQYFNNKGCKREGKFSDDMKYCFTEYYWNPYKDLLAEEEELNDKTKTLKDTRKKFINGMTDDLKKTRKTYLDKEFELWTEEFALEELMDTAEAAKTGAMKAARKAADDAKEEWETAERKYADLNFDLMKEKYKIELIRHERELMQVDQCRALVDFKKKQRAAGYSETNGNDILWYMAAAGATFAALLFPIYFFNIWPFREGTKEQKAWINAEVQIPLKTGDIKKHFEPWHVWKHTYFDEQDLTYRYEGLESDINAYGIDGYPTPDPPKLLEYLPNSTIKKSIGPRTRPPKKIVPKEKKVPSKMHWKHAKKHAKCAKKHLRCKQRTAQMAALIDRATRLGEGYAPANPRRDVRKSRKPAEAEENQENPKGAPDVAAPDEAKAAPEGRSPTRSRSRLPSLMKDEDKTQVTGTLEAPIVDELMVVQKSASGQVKSGQKKPEPEPLFRLAEVAHGNEEKTQAQTIAQPPASAEKTQVQTIMKAPASAEKTQMQTIVQQPTDGKNKSDKSDKTQMSAIGKTEKPSLPRDEKKPAP